MTRKKLCLVACDAFQYELESVQKECDLAKHFGCTLEVIYLSQKLHLDFDLLKIELLKVLRQKSRATTILLYGSKCHPDFATFLPPKKVFQLAEINCMHALSGENTQNKPRTFFLNPLQLERWQDFFAYREKNLEQKQLFKENFCHYCDNAIFKDTGVKNISQAEIDFFQQATGLPVKVEKIGLAAFKSCLQKLIASALQAEAK